MSDRDKPVLPWRKAAEQYLDGTPKQERATDDLSEVPARPKTRRGPAEEPEIEEPIPVPENPNPLLGGWAPSIPRVVLHPAPPPAPPPHRGHNPLMGGWPTKQDEEVMNEELKVPPRPQVIGALAEIPVRPKTPRRVPAHQVLLEEAQHDPFELEGFEEAKTEVSKTEEVTVKDLQSADFWATQSKPVPPMATRPMLVGKPLSNPAQGASKTPAAQPATYTPAFHMLSHETPVPNVKAIKAKLHRISLGRVDMGAQHNPTVWTQDGALKVVVRVLNGMKTTNYVADVTDNWGLSGARKIISPDDRANIEDLRVFLWKGRPWAIAATHNAMPGVSTAPALVIRQALLELTQDGAEILKAYVQPSQRHEKNWMPCVSGQDELKLIYSTQPLAVLNVLKTAASATGIQQVTGHIRGGSQLIPWGKNYLAIVHQVHRPPRVPAGHSVMLSSFWPSATDPVAGDAPVVYLHQFALFDSGLTQVKLSGLFYFNILGIEFCAGLARFGGKFVASFGVSDKEAWLAEIEDDTIERMFT